MQPHWEPDLRRRCSDFGRMLSVGAIRFEDRFCASRKDGTGGGGWVHRSGWQHMAAVAAGCRKALVSAGWAIRELAVVLQVNQSLQTLD